MTTYELHTSVGNLARSKGALDWHVSPQSMVDRDNGQPFEVALAMAGDLDCYTSKMLVDTWVSPALGMTFFFEVAD